MSNWKNFFTGLFVIVIVGMIVVYFIGFGGFGEINLEESGPNSSSPDFSQGLTNGSGNSNNSDSPNGLDEPNLNGSNNNSEIEEDDSFTSNNMQFYKNLRYKDKKISYEISNEGCTLKKESSARRAFNILSNETALDFYAATTSESPEIFVSCQSTKKPKGEMFVAGEGGPINITKSGDFNVIHYGEVLLIEEEDCSRPNVAIHEILHAVGFKHSPNENNIMYSQSTCSQEIGEDIPNALNEIYSIPSLPDLTLEDVSVSTHDGQYLDYNATIRNEGLEDSGQFNLSVYKDSDLVKETKIDPLDIGFGTKLVSKNINLKNNNFEKLSLTIEYKSNEINKENNRVVFEQK